MLHAGPTEYSTLPAIPQINAMPQGIPSGPWGPLYRSAPGAQIPAVQYPGMMGAFGQGRAPVRIDGAFGQEGDESFWGIGKVAFVSALFAAATGAAYAFARESNRPVLYPALTLGGFSLVGTLLGVAMKQ